MSDEARDGRIAFVMAGVLFALAAGPVPDATQGASRAATPEPTGDEIRAADLVRTIEQLASPQYQGRLAGSPGYLEAAGMAAGKFRELGLRPGGGLQDSLGAPADTSANADTDATEAYFQDLAIEYNPIEECALALVGPDGTARELQLGRDFACRGLTGSGKITAPVVFAGYGLSLPEKGYDDYAGVDVRGKVVLAFKEAPPFTVDSTGWGQEWMPSPKGRTAAAHGAVALLVVSRPKQEHPQRPIGSMLEGDAPHAPDFPRLQVDLGIAEELVASTGLGLAGLESRIDSTRAPSTRLLNVSARVRVRARYEARQRSVNVIGILEGSDPMLKNEYVVLGAHLDHVGSQGNMFYPGANDNASGSAVVLAAASALARGAPWGEGAAPPRRSVVFGLWSSEEAGLLGAQRFIDQPPVPRKRIVAYLNFDCVGHGDSIEIGGGKSYPGLWELARALDSRSSNLVVAHTWEGGGADAAPFEEAGIPNLYFASRFSYTHLHLPSDTPETINPALLEAVARLGTEVAWRIAQEGTVVR